MHVHVYIMGIADLIVPINYRYIATLKQDAHADPTNSSSYVDRLLLDMWISVPLLFICFPLLLVDMLDVLLDMLSDII